MNNRCEENWREFWQNGGKPPKKKHKFLIIFAIIFIASLLLFFNLGKIKNFINKSSKTNNTADSNILPKSHNITPAENTLINSEEEIRTDINKALEHYTDSNNFETYISIVKYKFDKYKELDTSNFLSDFKSLSESYIENILLLSLLPNNTSNHTKFVNLYNEYNNAILDNFETLLIEYNIKHFRSDDKITYYMDSY